MPIGENIRRLREDRDMTQAQLAGRCGIDQSYIAKVETGVRSPTFAFMEAAARAMGCGMVDMLDAAPARQVATDAGAEAPHRRGRGASQTEGR